MKYAEKQTRRFDEGKLKAGQSVIGLQVGDVGLLISCLFSVITRGLSRKSARERDAGMRNGMDLRFLQFSSI